MLGRFKIIFIIITSSLILLILAHSFDSETFSMVKYQPQSRDVDGDDKIELGNVQQEQDLISYPPVEMKEEQGYNDLSSVETATRDTSSSSTCQPVHHIYYLKCHKTGSSTMGNILNRLTITNNLTLIIFGAYFTHVSRDPDWLQPGFVIPHPFDLIPNGRNEISDIKHKYDINLQHSIFNEKSIFTFMKEDTKLIATIRHPFNHLKSSFNHYRLPKMLHIEHLRDPLEHYLKDPWKYEYHRGIRSKLSNRMTGEFGTDVALAKQNETYFNEYLAYLKDTFHHVVIAEDYDTSLVLLKRKFCWDMKTILYSALRNKTYSNKNQNPPNYEQYYSIHRNYTSLDYKLYETFLEIHKREVEHHGTALQEEVKLFQSMLEQVNIFCMKICSSVSTKKYGSHSDLDHIMIEELTFEESIFNMRFSVYGGDCILFHTHRKTYLTLFKSKQFTQACGGVITANGKRLSVNPKYCESNGNNFMYENFPYGTECTA